MATIEAARIRQSGDAHRMSIEDMDMRIEDPRRLCRDIPEVTRGEVEHDLVRRMTCENQVVLAGGQPQIGIGGAPR